MTIIKVRLTLTEELLGTASASPEIHKQYIASLAPDAASTEQEVAALGVEAVIDKSVTVFPRVNGQPVLWDYQIKGFFKDACSMLARAPGTKSNKLKAHKKVIDGLVFPAPRSIPLRLPEGAQPGRCQRPLRAQTAQGERIALANSETAPAGTTLDVDINILDEGLAPLVMEWLAYGEVRGLGQWRNSGKGRFKTEVLK